MCHMILHSNIIMYTHFPPYRHFIYKICECLDIYAILVISFIYHDECNYVPIIFILASIVAALLKTFVSYRKYSLSVCLMVKKPILQNHLVPNLKFNIKYTQQKEDP